MNIVVEGKVNGVDTFFVNKCQYDFQNHQKPFESIVEI